MVSSCIVLLVVLCIITDFDQLQSFPIRFSISILSPIQTSINNLVDGSNYPGDVTAVVGQYSFLKVFDNISGYSDDEFPSDFPLEEGIYGEILPSSLRTLFEEGLDDSC